MRLTLTNRERSALKARAHALAPVVQVGQAGLTDRVVAEIDRALAAHELIKVRVDLADRAERADVCQAICARTGAAEMLHGTECASAIHHRPYVVDRHHDAEHAGRVLALRSVAHRRLQAAHLQRGGGDDEHRASDGLPHDASGPSR